MHRESQLLSSKRILSIDLHRRVRNWAVKQRPLPNVDLLRTSEGFLQDYYYGYYRCAQQMWEVTIAHNRKFETVFDHVIEALHDDFEVLVSEVEELTDGCWDKSYTKDKRSTIKVLRKRMRLLEELYNKKSKDESSLTLVEDASDLCEATSML